MELEKRKTFNNMRRAGGESAEDMRSRGQCPRMNSSNEGQDAGEPVRDRSGRQHIPNPSVTARKHDPASQERGSWQQYPHTQPVVIVLNFKIQLCRNRMAISSWEVTSTWRGDGSQAKVSDTMSASHHRCGEKGRKREGLLRCGVPSPMR